MKVKRISTPKVERVNLGKSGVPTISNNIRMDQLPKLPPSEEGSWYNKTTGLVDCSYGLIECNEELITCL